MTQPYMCEPELIAATENLMPDLNNDLILAKNFLKQQSAATGDSLYDHMVDLVHKILSQKPPDVVDDFEHYSWGVKLDKFRPNFDLLNDVYLAPPQLATVRLQEEMYRLVASKSEKMDTMDEEEQELDLEEEGGKARIVDLVEHNYYFREGGYGLPASECFAVFIALKMLGIKEPVSTVRFFGKIFGTQKNYYVAETELTVEELDRRIRVSTIRHLAPIFREARTASPSSLTRQGILSDYFMEFEMKDMPGEGEETEEKDEGAEEQKELEGEGEGLEDKNKEPVPPKLPPIPQSTWQPPPPIPVERPGQGVNKKVYWVCNVPGEAWTCLPDVSPDQIRVSRLIVRCMTGDLDTEIQSFPPFDGTERNLLRAQIARIQASTSIAPQGFYTFGSGEEEEDIDLEEGMGDMAFNPNPYYRGHTIKDLMDPDMTYWVHHGRHILPQGRTIWWNPNAGMDEGMEEEEDEGPPPVAPESGPTLLSPVSEDLRVEGQRAWAARRSTALAPERALVTLRSAVWPGAVAYATDGKKSECMYVGWTLKYQPPNFSPLQLPRPQDEYPVGPEVMEMQDPSFADEEAYRIARLPPPIPELPGEGVGEGFGEEDDEEED